MANKYEVVIGLEIHAQLATKSKMFCGCDNNAEGREPNSVTCPVCMGMPGTLPVINKKAFEWTYLLGLALNCEVATQFNFERKQYFYPDLPKAYQITSQTTPPLIGGYLDLEIPGGSTSTREVEPPKLKHFTLEHIHLEEDAGKLIHVGDHSLVDLNRAGTPLLEIVSNPDFRSSLEAKLFMQELQRILRYLGISTADMEKGHLRCDANISLREFGAEKLGKKVEVKNMNSFSSLERAMEYEIKRQTEMLDKKEVIEQETRGWDDAKGITTSQRSKEEAHDYRYFPEPDLPPIVPVEAFDLEGLEQSLGELPAERRKRYEEMGLNKKDAETLVADKDQADYYEEMVEVLPPSVTPQKAANFIITDVRGFMSSGNIVFGDFAKKVPPRNSGELLAHVASGVTNSTIAKSKILPGMFETSSTSGVVMEEQGLGQVSDTGELEKIISEIIANSPAQVEEYRAGKIETLNWFVGQAMKATRGQANPGVVMEILKKLLAQ